MREHLSSRGEKKTFLCILYNIACDVILSRREERNENEKDYV